MAFDPKSLEPELIFSTSRSSGAGGQNVNKVNTKVTLRFDVYNSSLLTAEQKDKLLTRLRTRLTNEGVLLLSSQEQRTQLKNKESAIAKFNSILSNAFREKKKRKATKPSKSSVAKRLKGKKTHSEKKQLRARFRPDH
ncbi:MAG TPA: alternative ribosome rescue aminoacyl-tRNA hydrolase ArfB [Chryseosolibacter sp.]|nr:alternative ribosome rescue aminoacyl-tRNA hydrolase ArfB [Chryseosolibacter sp.]